VRRQWWDDAVTVTVTASVVVVVLLWVSHGGLGDLTAGAGSAFSSLGRLTGLVGSDLLLLQVIAMARVPAIERSLGQDRLARWHRFLGFTSVNLLLVHVVLITIGYALLDRLPFLSELWSLVVTAPGMLLATAGTVLFVLVAVTSMRVARRRLRYESWHLLHLYAYLGAGLALPHQLWTGQDFLASTAATVYWWSLYGVALALVLVYRVAVPLVESRRQQLRVTGVVPESPGVVSVYVSGPRLASMRVAAGQFFVWRFRTGAGWTRGHPLSISAAPTSAALRVTVATSGDDGERIASLAPGTRVLVEGPYGRLTPDMRTRPGLVLIAGGLGVAPLLSVLQDAALGGTPTRWPVTLVRRTGSDAPQPLQADLDHLAAAGLVRVIDLTGPRSRTGTPWLPEHLGHIAGPEALHLLAPDLDDCDVYVCGAAPWAEAVEADAHRAGVPADALHIERFTW
jgi:predicted ferric reductase